MASNRFDILVDNTGDVLIEDDDVLFGPSDQQHIQDTINAFPGYYKENPQDGVGVSSYLNSSGQEQILARSVKVQLTADGYDVSNPTVNITADSLTINPNATIL